MKRQTTIGQQFTLGFLGIIVLFLILGYSAHSAINSIGMELEHAVNFTAKKMDLVGVLLGEFQDMKAYARRTQFSFVVNHLVQGNEQFGATATCSMCHILETRGTHERELGEMAAGIKATVAQLQPLVTTKNGEKYLQAVRADVDNYASLYSQYLKLTGQNQFDDAHGVLRDQMFPIVDEIEKAMRELRDEEQKGLAVSELRARETVSRAQRLAVLVFGLSIAVGIGVLLMVRRSVQHLRGVAAGLRQGAQEVASAAAQVSSAGQSVAQSVSEQSTALEETSASSDRVSAVAGANNAAADETVGLSASLDQRVVQINAALEQMMSAMLEIGGSGQKISSIIKVIDEIAFQTNLLALNAAVEAARAGETGLGFAIVAEEVRNLAQRSAQAARDSTALIEESAQKSSHGMDTARRVVEAVQSITGGTKKMRTLAEQVRASSLEQSHGLEQIACAVRQAQQAIQATAAGAEETAATGEELHAQSSQLESMAEQLIRVSGT
jgi:methyl-accepting chemotaxis protein